MVSASTPPRSFPSIPSSGAPPQPASAPSTTPVLRKMPKLDISNPAGEASPLISSHPSTSGLQISLHPLALLTISDYITRHTLRNGTGPIIGALLGTQEGRVIDIEHAYEVLLLVDDDGVRVEEVWFADKLKLFKETHPALDLLGWFTTTSSPTFAPSDWMVSLHKQLLSHNESLILLCLNPSPSASVGGGGKLPLAIYESIYEADDSTAEVPETGKALKLLFVPLNYTIETGEAEMIGVDFVAKGGFGNAAAEASGLEGSAIEASASAKDGAKKVKLDEEKDTKGKGKEKLDEAPGKDGEAPVSAGTQNDELLATLTAKANAIRMLHSRIRLLTTYLSNPPDDKPNHQLLRSLKSLTNSRLALLTPADAKGFRQEQLAEQSDVHLVALLGTLTRSIEEVRGVGKKFWGIEQTAKASAAGRGTGGGGMGDWGERSGRDRRPHQSFGFQGNF